MAVEVKDILLKAAEDVQSGMWCRGVWFRAPEQDYDEASLLTHQSLTIEQAQVSRRCAEGSLALAVALAGGTMSEYRAARNAVETRLPEGCNTLAWFNDHHLPNDPFEAGQQLAELFRTTAEAL